MAINEPPTMAKKERQTKWRANHQREIKEYYQKNITYFREYQRQYSRTHREEYNKRAKEYRLRHPEQLRAWRKIARIPANDKCAVCGTTENLHRHHPDYSKPLYFVTLCKDCHLRKVPLLEPQP